MSESKEGYVIGNPVTNKRGVDIDQQMRDAFPAAPFSVFDNFIEAKSKQDSLLRGKDGYQCPWFDVEFSGDIKKTKNGYIVNDAGEIEVKNLICRVDGDEQEVSFGPASPTCCR